MYSLKIEVQRLEDNYDDAILSMTLFFSPLFLLPLGGNWCLVDKIHPDLRDLAQRMLNGTKGLFLWTNL